MAMTPSASEIFAQVARQGYRLTRTRRAVIESLAAANGPTCVRALHTAAGAVDLVTVYRAMGWLVKLGLAQKVPVGHSGERYELVDSDPHTRHHCHCDGCGGMTTIAVCELLESVFADVLREHGFVVHDYRITFYGCCAACSVGQNGKSRSAVNGMQNGNSRKNGKKNAQKNGKKN